MPGGVGHRPGLAHVSVVWPTTRDQRLRGVEVIPVTNYLLLLLRPDQPTDPIRCAFREHMPRRLMQIRNTETRSSVVQADDLIIREKPKAKVNQL